MAQQTLVTSNALRIHTTDDAWYPQAGLDQPHQKANRLPATVRTNGAIDSPMKCAKAQHQSRRASCKAVPRHAAISQSDIGLEDSAKLRDKADRQRSIASIEGT
jgi:hypothetical protein